MFSSVLRLRKLGNNKRSFIRTVSALYITGDKASDTFAVLTPHIDFEERLQHKHELINNLKLRELDVNLDDVIRLWNFYKHVESKKIDLENSKTSISQTIISLSRKGDKYSEKINTLKAHGKMIKDDLKILKESFWSVEEKAAIQVLSLPNVLHSNTPERELNIIHSFLKQPEAKQSDHHLNIAIKNDLIEYNDPFSCYLKNDAALYELYATFYLSDQLLNKNYVQFANADFARSVVVDGCGIQFSDPKTLFTLIEDVAETDKKQHTHSRLHLIGGASLSSFMAYYCKHTVFPTQLPLRYFTVGRAYRPAQTQNTKSLLNVAQHTAVHLFVATKDDLETMNAEFENVLQHVIDIYESLNYHFRVCYIPAKELHNWECLRASIQMFSSHRNEYVEVGNISLCGNYVSKRLLFNYGKGYDINYPCVISGTIMAVPKLLACVLEANYYKKEAFLPDVFKSYIQL